MLKPILFLTAVLQVGFALNGELENVKCPVDCHCHYFRINLVTDCSESNLTSIPYDELSPVVYILDMNGNNIAHMNAFPEDIKLRRLQMAHNQLTQLTNDSFAKLAFLLEADISYNQIKTIHPDAFRNSPGFINLELQNNPLEEVKDYFLNCSTLLYLDLNTCGIQRLNDNFFQHTPNLNYLDLSNNPLKTIEQGPFNHLTKLINLKLNRCNLTKISPKAFSELENLQKLEMADNDLKNLAWTSVLAPLVRLEHLDIRHTEITDLPGDAFAKNLYLYNLVLADNELSHLDVGNTLGHNLHTLQSLDLSNCNLKDQLAEEAFRNASKLRDLNLNGNPTFAGNLTEVLRHLPTLHKLSLSNCNLRQLPNAFDVLENLKELDISHNPLSNVFIRLNPLKSLEYVDMSYCNLEHLGNNTFAQTASLKRLILSGNKLDILEQSLFANLTRLNSLELKNCDLKAPLNPMIFGDRAYMNIIELKLSGNPLVIPKNEPLLPKQLSSLEILDLSNCNLENLYENMFSRTRNLTQLNLSGNKIKGPENLSGLKKLTLLEHLDLSSNNLSTINSTVFKANPQLISINLMNNPFVCNCSIVDIWDWAIKVKNNLDVLVGSQPSYFAANPAKLRRSLSCFYDPETYRNIIDQNRGATDRKPFLHKGDLTPNRTWAKYIRESNCSRKT